MDVPARPHELLLTGVTGFVGKVILQAALRRAEGLGIEAVHVLVRAKGGRGGAERFAHEVARSRCFERLPEGWERRVRVVDADLASAGGALEAALAPLRERVTHVVHAAASVEFDRPLAEAVADNVEAPLRVLAWARGCPRLARLVSLSTAYVTPAGDAPVREALAPLPWPADAVARDVREGRADEAALLRESRLPNTYTLSKCLAEHLLAERRGDLPLVLLRPSIVSAAWREPFPGWIDSQAAFAAFVLLIGSGQLRAAAARPDARLDLVPCDAVAQLALDAAFAKPADGDGGLRIVHAVAGAERSASIALCRDTIEAWFSRHPLGPPPRVRYVGPDGPAFRLREWWHHRLRLGAAALWERLRGRPSRANGARSLAERLRYVNRAFRYFTHHSFDFRSSATLPAPGFEPRAYLVTVCEGVHAMTRRGTLASARRRRAAAAATGPA